MAEHDGLYLTKLTAAWPDVVGAVAAQNSRPIFVGDRMLVVEVTSSEWAQQLAFLTEGIVSKVGKSVPGLRVDALRLRTEALCEPRL